MLKFLWPAIALLIFSNAAAANENVELRTFRIGEWSASVFGNPSSGAVSGCFATASYRSGIYLTLGITQHYVWSLGIGDPRWKFRIGQQIPISYAVDNGPIRSAVATAVSFDTVNTVLPDEVAVFNEFRRGRVLLVKGSGDVLQFSLTKTSQLLTALAECVRPPAPIALARPSLTAEKPTSPQGYEEHKVEAMAVATDVLQTAGFKGFRFLRGEDVPGPLRHHDAVWSMIGGAGTLRVLSDSSVQFDTIKAHLISTDAKICKGTFASGVKSPDPAAQVATVFTSCESEGIRTQLSYFLIKRPEGGHYIFSILFDGTSESFNTEPTEVDNVEENLRQAALKSIN